MGAVVVRIQSEAEFKAARLAMVPPAWRQRVDNLHRKKHDAATDGEGRRLAGLWLWDLSAGMAALKVPVNLTDGELCDLAARRAAECMSAGEYVPGKFIKTLSGLRARMEATVTRYGIAPPDVDTDAGAVARMTCPLWWRRALRKAQARALEGKAIELGYIHKRGEIYASDATVARRQQQKARNAAGLENTTARNLDTGQEYTLAALAAVSVANPRIRRGELMTRIAGFEAIAKGVGDAGEFVTLTAPSKYHPMLATGQQNPNYATTKPTPRDTAGYLARVWARIRAALARVGIRPYGFRIAEPHHDATPHWHLLLFMGSAAVAQFRAIFTRYALAEDGTEAGAATHRATFKAIDWANGSAAGYIAKYVSKNIDGGGWQVQGDTEGGPGDIFPGHRVEAWAATWGIRQFQQIGGPPVGIWRELRRLEADETHPPALAAARAAADCGTRNGHDETGAAGNWRRYVEIMGGPAVARAALPLRLAFKADGTPEGIAPETGEIRPATNRYGETRPGAVYGLVDVASGAVFATVRHAWEIRPAGVFEVAPDFPAPWSPVNNCTQRGENHDRGSRFEAEIRRRPGAARSGGGHLAAGSAAPGAGNGRPDRDTRSRCGNLEGEGARC